MATKAEVSSLLPLGPRARFQKADILKIVVLAHMPGDWGVGSDLI